MNGGGLRVVTTLDLQQAAAAHHMAELRRPQPGLPDHHATDAVLVTLEPATGDILAMVGSADYWDESIDGAVNVALAHRQPGSAINPITYATAFDPGRWGLRHTGGDPDHTRPRLPFTPATVLSDVPTGFTTREGEPYRPQNYDCTWHGPISLRQALATSANLVAVSGGLTGLGAAPMYRSSRLSFLIRVLQSRYLVGDLDGKRCDGGLHPSPHCYRHRQCNRGKRDEAERG